MLEQQEHLKDLKGLITEGFSCIALFQVGHTRRDCLEARGTTIKVIFFKVITETLMIS